MYDEFPYTVEALTKVFIKCMLDWNVDRILYTITLDHFSTNDSLVTYMLNKLDCFSLICDGQLLHMRCCTHILNLISQDGLSVLWDCIKKG